jgi:hypothetical protein
MKNEDAQRRVGLHEGDIVRTLTLVSLTLGTPRSRLYNSLDLAIDEIERQRVLIDKWTDLCIQNLHEINRLQDELAARCGDARPGAHTAGPSETFIPEAL